MSPSPSPEEGKQIQYPKRCVLLCSLEYRTMDEVQKASNSKNEIIFNMSSVLPLQPSTLWEMLYEQSDKLDSIY
jgi:hypothetical protein